MTDTDKANNGWFKPDACLFCGVEELEPWLENVHDRLRYVEGTWSFLKCSQCGSAHLSPMPSREMVENLYPPIYSFRPDFETESRAKGLFAKLEEKAFYRLVHKREVDIVKRNTGISSGSILDVGCGTGDRLLRFARAGFDVRGLEFQPKLVKYIQDQFGLKANAGTLDTVVYDPGSFDIVMSHWVIEHLHDIKSTLAKMYSMIKDNGWIVLEVPLADSNQSRFLRGRWTQFCEAPRHLAIPSKSGIEKALAQSGFKDINIISSSIMNCASTFALSLIPGAAAIHAYGNGSLSTHIPRIAAGMLTVLYVPLAITESHMLHQPAGGLVFARKA